MEIQFHTTQSQIHFPWGWGIRRIYTSVEERGPKGFTGIENSSNYLLWWHYYLLKGRGWGPTLVLTTLFSLSHLQVSRPCDIPSAFPCNSHEKELQNPVVGIVRYP